MTAIIKKNEKGFLLVMSYLLLTVLAVLTMAIFTQSVSFIKAAERNKKKIVAFNLAEAGLDDAYYRIKNGTISAFPWSSGYTSMSSGSVQGGYSTTVTDMGGGVRKVVVTAYSPAQSSTTESVESRTVTGYLQIPDTAVFNFGVFAKTSVAISSSAKVDAYNSNNGSYGGDNVFSRGNIGTDSAVANTVVLSGNANVKGNITTGVGSTPTSVVSISGSASMTGTKTAATAAQNPQSITTSEGSSGGLSINNGTVTLAAGSYNYSSISISGSGRLVATGAVTIYCNGTIAIGGNGITTSSNKPPNMIIYSTGSSPVTISGNGSLYAGIYAPNSAVTNTGSGAIYGAVTSDTYTQSGSGDLHFDEALMDPSEGTTSTAMLSWNESALVNS